MTASGKYIDSNKDGKQNEDEKTIEGSWVLKGAQKLKGDKIGKVVAYRNEKVVDVKEMNYDDTTIFKKSKKNLSIYSFSDGLFGLFLQ